MTEQTATQTTAAVTPEKKPYARPELKIHGTVADLTAINGSGTADKSLGSVADL